MHKHITFVVKRTYTRTGEALDSLHFTRYSRFHYDTKREEPKSAHYVMGTAIAAGTLSSSNWARALKMALENVARSDDYITTTLSIYTDGCHV